jgi:hypothetical protein
MGSRSTYGLAVGDQSVAGLAEFDTQLRAILSDKGTGFDQVLIQVGTELNYEELMQVVDVCNRQKLPDGQRLSKLSFVPLPQTRTKEENRMTDSGEQQ